MPRSCKSSEISSVNIATKHSDFQNRPPWDFEAESIDDPSKGDPHERFDKASKSPNSLWPKPAADHRDWKWTMMWEAWTLLCDLKRRMDYCNPDNFDMHIYNDFYAYGIKDLVEEMVLDFEKAHKKAGKDESSLWHMWAVLAALYHWLEDEEALMTLVGIDDDPRVNVLIEVVGCAFLTGLEAIDNIGELKPESKFKDLGLMMSIYLDWSNGLPDYGIENDDGEIGWRKSIVGYAKKGGIDLEATDCYATSKGLENDLKKVKPLKPAKKSGRWHLPKHFTEYKRHGGFEDFRPYNLPGHDITKWSRKLRAEWSFDEKDPLADISEKDLKEGNIMLR